MKLWKLERPYKMFNLVQIMVLSIRKTVFHISTKNLQSILVQPRSIGQNWRWYEICPLPVNMQVQPNHQITNSKNLVTIELENIGISLNSRKQLYRIYMN